MLKRIFVNYLNRKGLEIKRKYNGFSLNSELNWLTQKRIRTVLDIGANEGQFAAFVRGLIPDAKIFSFEPIASCYDKLIENTKSDKNLIPFNLALGEKNQDAEMFKNDFSPSSSLLKIGLEHVNNFPFTGRQTKETVRLAMLDSIKELDDARSEVLMKVDVQGYEMNVIKGGVGFISKFKPVIVLEVSFANLYENEPPFDELYNFMQGLNYSFKGVLDQMYSPIDGKILQADVIFENLK